MKKWVFNFNEGNAEQKSLLGGKGANLAEMTNIGLPVPPGFIVSTEACLKYYQDNKELNSYIIEQIDNHLNELEIVTGKIFGDIENPLLVSIRSGAAVSMPGMMDTILNLGLNDETVEVLAVKANNASFAYDSYRRFIQMFSDVACGVAKHHYENLLDKFRKEFNISSDADFTLEQLKLITKEYKDIHKRFTGEDFPQEPKTQLYLAIQAVFDSWNNSRAITYRKIHNISHDMGTAVNVQAMVFGNMGYDCGTGVAFTRNPATGERKLYGEYLINAQGEDVVAGIRTPMDISRLANVMPKIYHEFDELAKKLEHHYQDMQDIEFTIEKGKLYILQTRAGKRTAEAAVRIATELVEENVVSPSEAIMRVEPSSLDQLLHPTFDTVAMANMQPLAQGLPASPGAATGKVYFNAEDAVKAAANNEPVILVRKETSPEDIEGMNIALGILTSRGGMTSHAAVVARGMGKCCVAGCEELWVNEEAKVITVNGIEIFEGDYISLDGSSGRVYQGIIKTAKPKFSEHFNKLMQYAEEIKSLGIRANADTAFDAQIALNFGVEGIGLCRTEHMFFKENRIPVVRQMILSSTKEQRQKALTKLLPMQKKDFKELFEVMESKPVTIRLLDPPLHEFLPSNEEDILNLAKEMDVSIKLLKDTISQLHEINPMLGHRGCRLAITYPEIAKMQTRAIIEAALEVKEEFSIDPMPEIMVPLIGTKRELAYMKEVIENEASEILSQRNTDIKYSIGTMIEIPRAALLANEIAEISEFFSFGTNDLTQMGFGYSRDDAGKFINDYLAKGILSDDPFQSIDQKGIGQLVDIGVKLGRQTKPNLKIGVCGEHAGDAKSVEFFQKVGLDYVSCSPYRVPIAKLAAAQAQVKNEN